MFENIIGFSYFDFVFTITKHYGEGFKVIRNIPIFLSRCKIVCEL
jgi:hypothetical protein